MNGNKKIKAAYVTHASNLTGANRSLIDLTNSLKNMGVEPIVFLRGHGAIENELKKLNTDYYILPYQPWTLTARGRKTLRLRVRHIIKVIINKLLLIKAKRIVKKENIDLIHSNSISIGFGAQLAKAAGLPHIWHIREFMEEDQYITFYNRAESVDYLNKAKAVIAISDAVAQKFGKITDNKINVIYNGVDIEKYKIADKRLFRDERTELMIAGRIIKTKGQLEAVKAVEKLKDEFPDIHLSVIGSGTGDGYSEMTERYVSEHKLEQWVQFIPFQNDLTGYSRACDIHLVCSHMEAFGRVTVEGMLAHSVVIGADAGCTPYLIQDGKTGILYQCGSVDSLCDAVKRVLTYPDEAQIIADKGYEYALNNYSIQNTADNVYKLYIDILS